MAFQSTHRQHCRAKKNEGGLSLCFECLLEQHYTQPNDRELGTNGAAAVPSAHDCIVKNVEELVHYSLSPNEQHDASEFHQFAFDSMNGTRTAGDKNSGAVRLGHDSLASCFRTRLASTVTCFECKVRMSEIYFRSSGMRLSYALLVFRLQHRVFEDIYIHTYITIFIQGESIMVEDSASLEVPIGDGVDTIDDAVQDFFKSVVSAVAARCLGFAYVSCIALPDAPTQMP